MGTNFKLQVVKQSEDAEDEAVAVFQPKGPATALKKIRTIIRAYREEDERELFCRSSRNAVEHIAE